MVSHIVLLKPRTDLPQEEKRAFVAAFERAVTEIPNVRAVRVGARVLHGAAYEQTALDTADFVAVIDFEDLAGLEAYLRHPAHDELGKMFGMIVAGGAPHVRGSALVYDFEVGGIEMLREII